MIAYPNVKLNFGLRVLRKRPDGFHDLETLFVPYMGISDVLEINPSDKFSFEGYGVCWDNDLTVQAYNLMKADFDIPPVVIKLIKRSPVGAGLGGGSSDAAFALAMLNNMFSLGLDKKTLALYASRLGSDCAFFIYNVPMLGRGRGEILTPFDVDLSSYRIELTVPRGVSVSTREAYAGIKPYERSRSFEDILSSPVELWKGTLENDFEESVFAAHPQIAAAKQELYDRGAVYASMSGSGSSVFGLFKGQEDLQGGPSQ